MEIGKSYSLNVPLVVFMEKTLKVEFGKFVEERNNVISPGAINLGEFEDVAVFRQGANEYELPSLYWKYFSEVDTGAEPMSEPKAVPLAPEPPALKITGDSVLTGNLVGNGGNVTYAIKQPEPIDTSVIYLNPEYVLLDSIKQISTSQCSEPTMMELFAFYHNHLRNPESIYHGPVGIDGDAESALEKTRELYKLHKRSEAIEKLRVLVAAEQKGVLKLVDSQYL